MLVDEGALAGGSVVGRGDKEDTLFITKRGAGDGMLGGTEKGKRRKNISSLMRHTQPVRKRPERLWILFYAATAMPPSHGFFPFSLVPIGQV